jgi:two-component system cell cycle sensor histidine kinase/response regulator CckA
MPKNKATTVLVVDDSQNRLLIHSLLLQKSGFEVLQASDGAECFHVLQKHKPDIIILDVVLPDINGIEICRRIKSDDTTRDILILLVSGLEIESDDQTRGLDAGADGYVILPIKNHEFISRVRALERIKKSEDELRESHALLEEHSEKLERINAELKKEVELHKKTVEALRLSEQYSRSIINCSLDMIITVDTERKIVEFNKSAQKIFGYTLDEVVGRNISMLYADSDEGKQMHSVTLDDGNVTREVRNRRKNGEIFTSYIAASSLLNEKHELLGLVGVSRDITEQKKAEILLHESEERYRLLFSESPLGIVHIDRNGRLLDANKIVRQIFSISSDIHPSDDFVNLIGDHPMAQTIRDALRGIEGFFEGDIKPAGSQKNFTLRLITRSLKSSDHDVDSVICIIEDITEQRITQRQLIQSQKLESLGTLAGGIAHDFNNLLAMILGNAELLKRHLANDPKSKKYIESIVDVAHRGSSISKQMLLFSHQSELKMQNVSVAHIIEDLKVMLQHFIPRTIAIQTSYDGGNGSILCDIGHINQVILNLCINAKDAMGDHGTLVIAERTISGAEVRNRFADAKEERYVALSVSDTGSGIDDANVQKIFDPFYTTKERGKGTGLGLSIVDGIVRSHNGFIDVYSKMGEGTTFTLYFPAMVESVIETTGKDVKEHFSGKNILVVDDEEILVNILKEYLEEIGCTVMTAMDGLEAVKMYRKNTAAVDAVISDLGMPNMNGVEMYTEMKKINPAVKVIISSGYLDRTFRNQMKNNGIVDILNKPYKFEEIGDILERAFVQ